MPLGIRYLFGAVSISAALPREAREQLVAYYQRYYSGSAGLAESNRPFQYFAAPPSFGELDAGAAFDVLKANLAALGTGVPTLYRQYTDLCEPGGARFLAFGVDPDFSDSIDGLIEVDLCAIRPNKRKRYLRDAGTLKMSTLANLSPHRRAVFVSDVHLGSRHCHATELARFLSQLRCERLYLVGDIIDLWWMAHRRANWRQSHSDVIQALHALRRAGTEIIYIPGNHDASLRHVCGVMLAGHAGAAPCHPRDRRWPPPAGRTRRRVRRRDPLRRPAGKVRRLAVLPHPDRQPGLECSAAPTSGMRYWSLSEFLKKRSGAAERYIERFVQAGLDDVRPAWPGRHRLWPHPSCRTARTRWPGLCQRW